MSLDRRIRCDTEQTVLLHPRISRVALPLHIDRRDTSYVSCMGLKNDRLPDKSARERTMHATDWHWNAQAEGNYGKACWCIFSRQILIGTSCVCMHVYKLCIPVYVWVSVCVSVCVCGRWMSDRVCTYEGVGGWDALTCFDMDIKGRLLQ